MLELQLMKGSLFHNLLESILDLTDVANVVCSNTGLKLQALDTEHVVIIEVLFPAEAFQRYRCDERLSMGIAIDELVKAIRCANEDHTIIIKVGEENIESIDLLFESPNMKDTISYDLEAAITQSYRFQIPDWQDLEPTYQAFVQMPSAQFNRICKYLCNIGDAGDISVTQKGLKFFASGTSGHGSVNIKYMQAEEDTATVVDMREPVTLTLDLKYMNSFGKASSLLSEVKICLSNTQPLMTECKIGQMGYIRYFMTPKTKPDDCSGEVGVESSEKMKEQGNVEVQEGKIKGKKKELELQLVKGSLFHNLLELILDLTDVANVVCSSKGLKLQAVDTEHVGIIALLFPAEAFQGYHCKGRLSMVVAIDKLVKAIRCADKDDTIIIKVGEENIDSITLLFKSPNMKDNISFDFGVVDAQSQRFKIPDWQVLESTYQASVQMPYAQFKHICKYLCNIGNDGDISVTEKGVKFFALGTSGRVRVNIKYMQAEEDTATVVDMREPVTLTLDLKYMNSFSKASSLLSQVKICLSNKQPLGIECKIGQMGYIRYFVEPKIKPDDWSGEVATERLEEMKEQGNVEFQESKRKGRDDGNKETEGDRSKSKRKRSKKKAKVETDEKQTD